jgi:hypothetical protein
MTDQQIRTHLIAAGVKNLKEYGYPDVNETNILTDTIYKAFFVSMLTDNLRKSSKQIDNVIDNLIKEIAQ